MRRLIVLVQWNFESCAVKTPFLWVQSFPSVRGILDGNYFRLYVDIMLKTAAKVF